MYPKLIMSRVVQTFLVAFSRLVFRWAWIYYQRDFALIDLKNHLLLYSVAASNVTQIRFLTFIAQTSNVPTRLLIKMV